MKADVLKAIKCCRADDCEHCPLQLQICDELKVEMVELPEDLVDMVEDALSE